MTKVGPRMDGLEDTLVDGAVDRPVSNGGKSWKYRDITALTLEEMGGLHLGPVPILLKPCNLLAHPLLNDPLLLANRITSQRGLHQEGQSPIDDGNVGHAVGRHVQGA